MFILHVNKYTIYSCLVTLSRLIEKIILPFFNEAFVNVWKAGEVREYLEMEKRIICVGPKYDLLTIKEIQKLFYVNDFGIKLLLTFVLQL